MEFPLSLEKEIRNELKELKHSKIILRNGEEIVGIVNTLEMSDINPSSRLKEDKIQKIETKFKSDKDCVVDNLELQYYSGIKKDKIILSRKYIQPIAMHKIDSITITWELEWE